MEGSIARLEGAVRSYAWGSRTVLAELQGRAAPTTQPEAELWFGDHPVAPAVAGVARGPRPLDAVVAADPVGALGSHVARRFDGRLPFLLKVLAVEEPLSLQAHPCEEHARRGFAAEEADGLPRDHPRRVYRDAWAKPELLYALTPVDALCGFRAPGHVLDLLDALAAGPLAPVRDAVAAGGERAYPDLVRQLLTWHVPQRDALVGAIAEGARRLAATDGPHARVAGWLVRLAQRYPQDPGVAVAALLDFVELAPGEALHVPPGELHAYLRGTGVEVMASSDNVLRGGLTPKHVDVEGLLQVLRTAPGGPARVRGRREGARTVFDVPAPHFELSRVEVVGVDASDAAGDGRDGPAPSDEVTVPGGPAILLVVAGRVTVRAAGSTQVVGPGQAAFVAASVGPVALSGRGQVFRAGVGPAGVDA